MPPATFVVQGALFPLWLFFPMTSREDMLAGTASSNDVGHGVLSMLALAFMVTEMGFAAAGIPDKRFRVFTLAAAAASLLSGAAVRPMSSGIAEGDPTPWMGFVERVTYGSWLLWTAALAVVLLRRELTAEKRGAQQRLHRPLAKVAT